MYEIHARGPRARSISSGALWSKIFEENVSAHERASTTHPQADDVASQQPDSTAAAILRRRVHHAYGRRGWL